MKRETLILSALICTMPLAAGSALAADPEPAKEKAPMQQERIYGSQMMTDQERADYRDKMRAAKTVEEREQIRKEHHQKMVERAKERGVTLPPEPPARGQGGMMGPGGGMGGGMGGGRGAGSY